MNPYTRLTVAWVAALPLGGCVGLSGPGPETPAAPAPLSATPPLSFSVSGDARNGGEACFLRLEVAYHDDVPAQRLLLDIEFEQRTDNGWLGISWIEGLDTALPAPDRVGKPFRGEPHLPEVMHYALMDELLLPCAQLRARVTVTACDPGPCAPLRVDDRDNLFPLAVVDNSGG